MTLILVIVKSAVRLGIQTPNLANANYHNRDILISGTVLNVYMIVPQEKIQQRFNLAVPYSNHVPCHAF